MQSDFMYQAAAAGDVDVVSAYTSDGRIAQFDLVVLDDPRHVIPPYDAILLLSARRAQDEVLIAALKPLIGAIPVELMRAANLRASNGDTSADDAARWLEQQMSSKTPPR
jgi:osmoprotectant transport system permease protein